MIFLISIYINGRFYKDEQGVTHRSAMVSACLDNNKWVKMVYKEDIELDLIFSSHAAIKIERYIKETYVVDLRWEFEDKRYEHDWTEVGSMEELEWEFEPDIRGTKFRVRDLVFNEKISFNRDDIQVDEE